jgi:ComF family protein
MGVSNLTNALLSVLLAPACAACGAVLDTPLNGCVCRNCWGAIQPITPSILDIGGLVTRSSAVGEYEGSLREIVHALKYQGRRSIAARLAALMRRHGEALLTGADCVMPVPLHRRRERERGFNQAYELARHLGLPVIDALARTRATAPQVTLDAARRRANVRGAFRLRRSWFRGPVQLEGLTLVLVDDVSTTGATLEACAAVLRDARVAEVCALTAARVTALTAARVSQRQP